MDPKYQNYRVNEPGMEAAYPAERPVTPQHTRIKQIL